MRRASVVVAFLAVAAACAEPQKQDTSPPAADVVATSVVKPQTAVPDDPPYYSGELRVTSVDADGKRLRARVWSSAADENSRRFRMWSKTELDASGFSSIWVDGKNAVRPPLDILVTCPGFRSAELRDVRSHARVVLEKSKPTRVRISLAPGPLVPLFPYMLYASLRWIDADADKRWPALDPRGVRPHDHDSRFLLERVATVTANEPGRYRVALTLDVAGSDFGSSVSGGRFPIATNPDDVEVTVGDDGAPVDVVVNVDADALRESMKGGLGR